MTEGLHATARYVVVDFLRNTLPFNELCTENLDSIAQGAMAAFFPEGARIVSQGDALEYLYVVQKGGVHVFVVNDSGASITIDMLGDGAFFGALNLVGDSRADYCVDAVEDTFFLLLHKASFLKTLSTDPEFAAHCFQTKSKDLVAGAYSELRCGRLQARTEDAFYLFTSRVRDVITRPREIVEAEDGVHVVAQRMSKLNAASVLVRNSSGKIVGIFTDKDLREKVVARRTSYDLPVGELISELPPSITADAPCFDAVMEMMNRQSDHLAVTQGGEIVGVLSAQDMLVFQGSSPLALMREILRQQQSEGLYNLSGKIPGVIRSLVEEGAKAENIARIVSVLSDHMVQRILALLEEEFGPPPVPFCWLTAGSEGRQEQIFRTDQDNAIVYDDPGEDWEIVKACKLYFRPFGNEAVLRFTKCGYPLCEGGHMASKAKWRKPFTVWKSYFIDWIGQAEQESLGDAKVFFDFRPHAGESALGAALREHIVAQAPRSKHFIEVLARDSRSIEPPLTFYRSFIVDKGGEHKNRLDLKLQGLTPIVDFARLIALCYGIDHTNTAARLKTAMHEDRLPEELGRDILEAYDFMMQLRLVHQLRLIESGRAPHNHVDPSELTDLEKRMLKESFRVIGTMQDFAARLKTGR